MVFVYAPFMNTFFGTEAIDGNLWLYPVGSGFIVFIVVEVEKLIVSKVGTKK
jgi:hypothetical protein